MKTRKMVSILIIALVAVLMLTAVLSSVQAVDAAPKKVKVTWDANGGKIDSAKTKVTTVTKNTKIKKLLKAPKRTGYEFKGWYAKKSGGTKITATTKVKKKVTYYAQWKKSGSRVLNAEEKKLVGRWESFYFGDTYIFTDKGTVIYYSKGGVETTTGNFKVSGGKITFTNIVATYGGNKRDYPKTQVAEYKFDKTSKMDYLIMRPLNWPDLNYLDLSTHTTYSKMS